METAVKTIWKLDPTHSEIEFKVKHMMISTVSGSFSEFEGEVEAADDSFKDAKFKFNAKIDSISTKNNDRDTHLKSEDFFNAEKHPHLTFESKSFDGEKMVGDMTIKDVTKEVTLDVDFNGIADDQYGQTKAGFEATGKINRKDFGLNWSAVTEAGNVVVSDKVKLVANLQFTKQ
ncbi:Polyisoprenoid-binding protein YceI [Salegentibacter echinorum]|uniref:Polyisoprenoid-binding protein YceI n=1 Tax=Salegentibacter echinorum TaxID=1073325 RepID=A0A1M5BRE8_SALEC|nr:YceI family protein [Salegentibacter echinorum]SHF45113.1 Polyisoprenoid-binding protein YceI [Salegentibacter echinorum]